MPAKKTFHSIRVRGFVRFDTQPVARGIPSPLFREYIAVVTQSGANPPESSVRVNTLGAAPVWSRLGPGVYRLTLADYWSVAKTVVSVVPGIFGGIGGQMTTVQVYRTSADAIDFVVSRYDFVEQTQTPGDNNIPDVLDEGSEMVVLEIRVYP